MSNKLKILLIVNHDILEYNRIALFNDLGFDVFSVGVYANPDSLDLFKPYLPKLQTPVDVDLLEEFKILNSNGYTYGQGKLNLSKAFIDKFDVILASWIYEPIVEYWDFMKNKVIMYESIGQSDSHRETALGLLRKKGVKVIRMSDSEHHFPNYAGADATIDLEVDTDYYSGWTGEEEYIFTVNSAAVQRKHVSNTDLYLEITKNLPKKLYGSHNENFKASFCYNKPATKDEILKQYQSNRLYFSLGTKPCPVVLSFKEAMAVGCPVVTWGPHLGGITFKAHTFIDNGVNGFYSDNPKELQSFCQLLLCDYDLAKTLSKNSKITAEKNFSKAVIKKQWLQLFNSIGLL